MTEIQRESVTPTPDDVLTPSLAPSGPEALRGGTHKPSSMLRAVAGRNAPQSAGLLAVLVGVCVAFSILSPVFLSANNIINIGQAIAVTGIMAVPGTMLIIGQQFDLSVGSTLELAGVVFALVMPSQGVAVGVLAALGTGVAVGLINGFFVCTVGVNALITTLGTLAAVDGISEVAAGGQTVIIQGFTGLGNSRPALSIPTPVYILIAAAIGGSLLMRYTTFGRQIYTTGSNAIAARLVGIRTGRVIAIAFVLSGLAAALGGLILTSRLSAASPSAGGDLELSVLTAIVLGGASLSGGKGSVYGTMVGLCIIGVVNNGLTLLNVNSFYQEVASGALLIFAVTVDRVRARISGS